MKSAAEKLNEEFQLFLSSDELTPSENLNEKILNRVRTELNPSFKQVLLKVFAIHALISLVSLSLCSQFGFRALPIFDLMSHFMNLVGATYCLALCGIVYLGMSAFAFSFLLKPQEVKVVRQNKFLEMSLLTGASLGVFLCLGASVLLLPIALWVAGAVVGGVGSLEIGWLIRSQFRKKLVYGV